MMAEAALSLERRTAPPEPFKRSELEGRQPAGVAQGAPDPVGTTGLLVLGGCGFRWEQM